MIFYVAIPDSYKYECSLIEKEGLMRIYSKCAMAKYNNNEGYLFIKQFKETGEYIVGLSIKMENDKSKTVIADSLFLNIHVQ